MANYKTYGERNWLYVQPFSGTQTDSQQLIISAATHTGREDRSVTLTLSAATVSTLSALTVTQTKKDIFLTATNLTTTAITTNSSAQTIGMSGLSNGHSIVIACNQSISLWGINSLQISDSVGSESLTPIGNATSKAYYVNVGTSGTAEAYKESEILAINENTSVNEVIYYFSAFTTNQAIGSTVTDAMIVKPMITFKVTQQGKTLAASFSNDKLELDNTGQTSNTISISSDSDWIIK